MGFPFDGDAPAAALDGLRLRRATRLLESRNRPAMTTEDRMTIGPDAIRASRVLGRIAA
jgi:hypothetical protein